jgi:hypothetical protein
MLVQYRGRLGFGSNFFSRAETRWSQALRVVKDTFAAQTAASELLPAALLVLGLGAIYVLISRLSHWCAGIAAALVVCTVPLCYVQAPDSSSADVIPSCIALSVMGLGLGALGKESRWVRQGAMALGVVGLGFGWLTQGARVGVCLPAASVALTWVLTQRPRGGRAAALLAAVAALAAPCLESFVGLGPNAASFAAGTHPTFEAVFVGLGRDLFSWSALLPFALAALTEPPEPRAESEHALRVLSLVGVVLSFGASAVSGAGSPERFAGLTFVAASLGLWFWDIQRGARVSRPVALSLVLFVALMGLDFLRPGDARGLTFAPGATAAQLRELELLEPPSPALLMTCLALAIGGAALGGSKETRTPRPSARWSRFALYAGTLLGGLVLRFAYYPVFDTALSNRAALRAYEERARAGDELGRLGAVEGSTAPSGSRGFATADPVRASRWLSSAASPARRFVLLPRESLPRLNAQVRRQDGGHNVPILEASGLTLLAVNRLEPGETSVNPLDAILIEQLPSEVSTLDVELGGRVRVLGWSSVDEQGRPLAAARVRERLRVRVYYELTQGEVTGFCTFLHIDHRPSRFAAEHGDWRQYPMKLWRPGDRVMDEFEVELPLHFVAGDYPVYFGFGVLPCRDNRRLPVTRGAHDNHRVSAGTLRIR